MPTLSDKRSTDGQPSGPSDEANEMLEKSGSQRPIGMSEPTENVPPVHYL